MNQVLRKKLHIDGLVALILFGLFASCILAVLLAGAQSYRRLSIRDQAAYSRRTCAQYIATKVRQSAAPGAVSLSKSDDGDVLTFHQLIGDEVYLTQIYCYDGWLRDLFFMQGDDLSPEAGEKVIPASHLSLSLQDDLLIVHVIDATENVIELTLSLRTQQGGDP